MDIKISDEELKVMVENAVRKEVSQRMQKLIDQNLSSLFTVQNIQSMTYECVSNRIEDRLIKEALKQMDYSHLLLLVTNACVKTVTDYIKDSF